jgi:hypothetical protein
LPNVPDVGALPSAADAQKAVCTGLGEVTAQLQRLATINASTTAADIKELKAPIDTAVAAVKAANQVLNQATITELTTQYDSLTATVNALPDNAAVGETATRIQEGAVAVQNALGQARTALNCQ